MARCEYCGSSILFGGKTVEGHRFCGKDHAQRGALVIAGNQLPDSLVAEQTRQVHQGKCPRCKGSGPVDVHNSYRVWSAIVSTRWWTNTHVCCRRCARLLNLRDGFASLVMGWWGIPWGLFITPVQVFRNIGSAASGDSSADPSPALTRLVRLQLAARAQAVAAPAASASKVPELKWE